MAFDPLREGFCLICATGVRSDAVTQGIGVVSCIDDDVADPLQALDQPARLWAVAPVFVP